MAKKQTLSEVVAIQKEKIEALTDFSRKLKKELEECKSQHERECEIITDTYAGIIESNDKFYRLNHALNYFAVLLLGVAIGLAGVYLS